MTARPVTPPTAEELRRLSLVRHLFGLGVVQSRGSEPTAGLSILSFHDAAESFLQLACERYGTGENKADFMRYWELLEGKGFQVPQRETMRRLNAARRGLKHQGILPAKVELEGFRAAVTNFLYDSTTMLFGIDFERVTLVHLVADTEAREKLEEAYEALAAHDHGTALGLAAVAFIFVQRAYDRNQASTLPSHTPTSLRALATRSAFTGFAISNLTRALGDEAGRALHTIYDNNNDALKILSEAIELTSGGLDLKDYLLFRAHIPAVHHLIGGKLMIDWTQEPTEDEAVVRRCLNFTVEAAVRLAV